MFNTDNLLYRYFIIVFIFEKSNEFLFLFSFSRLINGIIEFDQKITIRSTSKKCWSIVITISFLYWFSIKLCFIYLFPNTISNITFCTHVIFNMPYILEIVIIITSWFFLKNLECRFQTLNDIICKRLPAGLVAIAGQWTHAEIATSLENVRLLHTELSELLKTFNMSYGQLLLNFFVFNCADILIMFNFNINIDDIPWLKLNTKKSFVMKLLPFIIPLQIIICMIYTIVTASRIRDKVYPGRGNITN